MTVPNIINNLNIFQYFASPTVCMFWIVIVLGIFFPVVLTRRVHPTLVDENYVLDIRSLRIGNFSSRKLHSRIIDPEDHRVTSLPGLSDIDAIKLKQYAGLLKIGENDRNVDGSYFYWLFEAATNPETAPLVIWLNGGPGCSSMDGLFLEHGPFKIAQGSQGNHLMLTLNPYSWHNVANIVYIDQPVGTGLSFSHSNGLQGYPINDDEVNRAFLSFLDKFFRVHSRYLEEENGRKQSREIYFSGESHAGHYIPSMVSAMLQRNTQVSNTVFFNIAGLLLGNPWINPILQYSATDVAYGLGLISLGQKYKLELNEINCQELLKRGKFSNRICFSLLDDLIDSSSAQGSPKLLMYDARKYPPMHVYPPGHDLVEVYLNQESVRNAIHASETPQQYIECADKPYNALAHQDGKGVTEELIAILDHGIRVLIFAGQYDLICNHIGLEKTLMNLQWKYQSEWNLAIPGMWLNGGKLAGYVTSVRNLGYINGMLSLFLLILAIFMF